MVDLGITSPNKGQEARQGASVAEVMQENNLDWRVGKKQVKYDFNGENRFMKDQFVLSREDTGAGLGIVGKDYKIIQNSQMFDFLDKLTFIGGKLELLRAGATRGGQRIFIHGRLTGGDLIIGNDDKIEKHIYIWNGFGGNSYKAFFVPFRLFCKNQLTGRFVSQVYKQHTSKGDITGVRIAHKGNVDAKLNWALDAINDAVIHFEAFQAVANNMIDTKVEVDNMKRYFQTLTLTPAERKGEKPSTRISNQRVKLEELFVRGKGNKGESVWDLFNGAVEYVDHFRSTKENTEKEENLFWGSGHIFKQKALTLATRMSQGEEILLPEGVALYS